MAGPGDEVAAAESRSRGGLRASDADREQVIAALKAAFVQGRLTADELGARVDRVYASQTYAELAAVIADIPTALTRARSPRPVAGDKDSLVVPIRGVPAGHRGGSSAPRWSPHHRMDFDHLGHDRLSDFLDSRRVHDGRLTARSPPPGNHCRRCRGTTANR
jgi:hypothetical protein